MQAVRIGILGLGTVGSAVTQVLAKNKEEITRRIGRDVTITHALVKDKNKARDAAVLDGIQFVDDYKVLVDNPDIDILVEVMGGEELAKEVALAAIANNKPLITANKALLAIHGNEIFAEAEKKNAIVAFEAAVAGGIPIIKAMREGLAANHIQWIAGIVNGTSNFILSQMADTNCAFSDALALAQKLGYAEAQPAMDIEGFDAAHKLAILAAIAFGIPLKFDDVYKEGIDKITPDDLAYAKQLGFRIKHLAVARRSAEGIELRVHPTLIPESCLISQVNGVNNAVLVQGDAVGATLYCGAGAGGEPTASAVIADIVDVARAFTIDPQSRVPHLAFQRDSVHDYPMLPMDSIETAYYLRLSVIERSGILAEITSVLGESGISIEAIVQKGLAAKADRVPIVIQTHPVIEDNLDRALVEMSGIDGVEGHIVKIRIELLDSPIDRI